LRLALTKARESLFERDGQLVSWFHGPMSRRESDERLRDKPPGAFLVRLSESQPNKFSLSYVTRSHHSNRLKCEYVRVRSDGSVGRGGDSPA
jgi:hypothetical protein